MPRGQNSGFFFFFLLKQAKKHKDENENYHLFCKCRKSNAKTEGFKF